MGAILGSSGTLGGFAVGGREVVASRRSCRGSGQERYFAWDDGRDATYIFIP